MRDLNVESSSNYLLKPIRSVSRAKTAFVSYVYLSRHDSVSLPFLPENWINKCPAHSCHRHGAHVLQHTSEDEAQDDFQFRVYNKV